MKRTIGRLAAEVGVNVETIRYYERIGVLRQPPATRGGRVYDDEALWKLRYVKTAQAWGFTLAEIDAGLRQAAQSSNFCASVRALAGEKLEALDREIEALKARRAELARFIEACAAKPDAERCPVFRNLHAKTGAAERRL